MDLTKSATDQPAKFLNWKRCHLVSKYASNINNDNDSDNDNGRKKKEKE